MRALRVFGVPFPEGTRGPMLVLGAPLLPPFAAPPQLARVRAVPLLRMFARTGNRCGGGVVAALAGAVLAVVGAEPPLPRVPPLLRPCLSHLLSALLPHSCSLQELVPLPRAHPLPFFVGGGVRDVVGAALL